MSLLKRLKSSFIFLLFFSLFQALATASKPELIKINRDIHEIYLTWKREDTVHSINVNLATTKNLKNISIYYDTKSHQGKIQKYRFRSNPVKLDKIYFLDQINTASFELKKLIENQIYYFVVGNNEIGFSSEKKFKTLSSASELKFIVGGDMGTFEATKELMKQAAKLNPQFAIIGGDIAYCNGKPQNWEVWVQWLKNWSGMMQTQDGLMIPFIAVIGNHEVNENYKTTKIRERAPFYFGFLEQGLNDKTYFVRHFGKDLVFYFLDTAHLYSHDSQVRWLKEELEKNKHVRLKFAAYHVPLYPSHRDFLGKQSVEGRKHWRPLFDQYHLNVAFEHHDHALKRTKVLKNDQPSSNGTLYLGDGCWGQSERKVFSQPYLEKAESTPHFWFVEVLKDKKVKFQAINLNGEVVDEVFNLW